MKDLPHHIKKLNRLVVRSEHRLELEDEAYAAGLPPLPQPTKRPRGQLRKQAKAKLRKEREARAPTSLTPEERNHRMKHRVPIFDKTSHPKPTKGNRPSHKKNPPI